MGDLPKRVEFHEEGPREGFQIEKTLYPLADRVALVEALAETGLKHIQVASFVNPKKVPDRPRPAVPKTGRRPADAARIT